jgi:hypothetical protein
MNLPMRQNKKRNQALDAFASVAKTWSEWRLGERASQTVAKGTKRASRSAAKARKSAMKAAGKPDSSGVKGTMKGTPLKVAGALALVGGVGAAVAKKLKGGSGAEPLYTPPPTEVAVGDLAAAQPGTAGATPATESAVATSESAIAAAGEPAADDVTEPTVPDTEPDSGEAADTDPAADAGAAGDSGAGAIEDDAIEETAVSAGADDEALEPAPAGDAHEDDSPTIPGDDPQTPAGPA